MRDFYYSSNEVGFTIVAKTSAKSNPRRHFHTWWELFYMVRGERNFFVGNKNIHIEAGDFLVIPPGILHRGINPKSDTCGLYNVFFDVSSEKNGTTIYSAEVAGILEKLESCIQLPLDAQKKVMKMFDQMAVEYSEKKENYVFGVRSIMMQILVLVSRLKNAGIFTIKPSHEMNRNFAEILNWINANYLESISLNDTARKFNITGEHLSRCFKEYTQFNFVEYVNSLRIGKSCNLLLQSKLPVIEIAMKYQQ